MSKLHTLVSDINTSLYTSQPTEADMHKFIEDVSASIYKAYEPRTGGKRNVVRFSSVGKPTRQLWYQNKYPEQEEELHLATRIKFMYGDIIEQLLFLLIKTAGYKVTDQQGEKVIDGIKGHIDGRVNGVLVDVKSASPHGYDKFVKGTIFEDDPFGYIAQISGYAEGEDEAAFIVMNKVTGQIHVATIDSMEMINFRDKVKEVKKALKKNKPPARCYPDLPDGKSGNRKLSMGCCYCGFKIECWKDANGGKGLRKFKYSNGSRFLTNVAKRPHQDIEEEDV